MAILLRLIRVALATAFSIVVFAALYEFFNAATDYIYPPEYIRDVDAYRHHQPLFGALAWGVVMRAPYYLFFGTLPLLVVFGLCEWLSLRKWIVYFLIFVVAGLFATRMISIPASLISAALSSYLYWRLAGRTAGVAWNSSTLGGRNSGGLRILDYAAYGVLAYLAFQLIDYGYYGAKLLWVTQISEPDLGTPPYTKISNREFSATQKVALMDFPNPGSCLKKSTSGDAGERMKEMDWNKINNSAEAEVCIFRLLASYGDISRATEWLEDQGLKVGERYSSAHPSVGRNGTLRVTGGHSIRRDGPKFPTTGFFRRAFYRMSYGMSVDATWSADGERLLGVRVGFTRL